MTPTDTIEKIVPGISPKDLLAHDNYEEHDDYDEEEALFVGGQPRSGPVILDAEDSKRLWEMVQNKEPVVLTERMQELIAHCKTVTVRVVD